MVDTNLIIQSLPSLLKGLGLSLMISMSSCTIGIIVGTFLGILDTSKNFLIRSFIKCYITLIRGTPMLIQIMFIFYVLPQLGIRVAPFWAAVLAIGLNSSAYVSQIIKAGITAINPGQREAAYVLGFSEWHITRYIILPQAIRIIFPALGNELITLIKDSSLASVIGVVELTKQGSIIISRTYDALSIYMIVAILYLLTTISFSLMLAYFERRMAHANH